MSNKLIRVFDNIGFNFITENDIINPISTIKTYNALNTNHVGYLIPYIARNSDSQLFETGVGEIVFDGGGNIVVKRVEIISSSNNNLKVDFPSSGNNFYVFANQSSFDKGLNNVIVLDNDATIDPVSALYLVDCSTKSIVVHLPLSDNSKNTIIEFKLIDSSHSLYIKSKDGSPICSLDSFNNYARLACTSQDWVVLNNKPAEKVQIQSLENNSDTFSILSDQISTSKIYWDDETQRVFVGGNTATASDTIIPTSGTYPFIVNNNTNGSDFIVYGSGSINKNLFFAYDGRVGINIPSGSRPSTVFHIVNTVCQEGLRLENRTSCYPANITLYHKPSTNITSGSVVSQINLSAKNSTGNQTNYAQIESRAVNTTLYGEKGSLDITVVSGVTGIKTIQTTTDSTYVGYSGNRLEINNNGNLLLTNKNSQITLNPQSSITFSASSLYATGISYLSKISTQEVAASNIVMSNISSSGFLMVSGGKIINSPIVQYDPETTVSGIEIPETVTFNSSLTKITNDIQIYPNIEGYKGHVLTHMGADTPARWSPVAYLNADGVVWNRFAKRPIKIEDGRIIFYANKPVWADGNSSSEILTQQTLEEEFGTGFDTIELIRNDTKESVYVKFAAEVVFGVDQEEVDLTTPLEDIYSDVSLIDPDGDSELVQGFAVTICSPKPWNGEEEHTGNGYAFSVTKGAYMNMQLGTNAKNTYNCVQENSETSLLKFKPSTLNSISIRPNTHTAFNMLGENIDFIVYGQKKTQYGNYDETIFGLNENNIPSGLVPAFKIDANISNAASGSVSSGIFFTKYLDRAKLNPSGWNYDTKSKLSVNTSGAYIVSSLATGVLTEEDISITGYIHHYADLTVNSILYSPNIITQDIYLRPKPLLNNTGKYIPNALLTIDNSGKIISRAPRPNPTIPGKPYNIILDPDSNGIGNGELSIKWTKPDNDGSSTIFNYIIQFSTNDGVSWTSIQSPYSIDRATTDSIRATIKGLSASTQYQFRVSAQNLIGIGDYSDASENMLPGSSVPKSPYDLTYTREFDNTIYSDISLSWEAGQNGSGPIMGYRIEESYDAGITWQNYNDTTNLITTTYETINGTESSVDYQYRVSAYNSYGQSSYSYIYTSGNSSSEDLDEAYQRENDILGNWDFGSVLFTGVCSA